MIRDILCYPTRVGPMVHHVTDKVIGRSLRLYGEWAPGETALLRHLIGPADRILDVGANVGYHSLFFAQQVGSDGQVWAFEPDPSNRALLQFNLLLSERYNCEVYPYLVGRESAVIKSWRSEMEPLNRGGIRFETDVAKAGSNEPPPDAPLMQVAIDDLSLSRCNLIKIDVEGAELDVLSGARATLRRLRPFVFHEQRDERNFAEIAELLAALDYSGYWSVTEAYPKFNFNAEQHNFFKGATETNVLWVPAQARASLRAVLDQLVPVAGSEFAPPRLSQLSDAAFLPSERPSAEELERVAGVNQVLRREEPRSQSKTVNDIADEFFGAIERGDIDAVAALYSPSVEVWHNFSGRAQNGQENLALLRAFGERVDQLQLEVAGRDHFPGGFVQRHTLRARFKSDAEIAAPTCMVVYLREGKIERVFEYLDPAAVRGTARAK